MGWLHISELKDSLYMTGKDVILSDFYQDSFAIGYIDNGILYPSGVDYDCFTFEPAFWREIPTD